MGFDRLDFTNVLNISRISAASKAAERMPSERKPPGLVCEL
jgi:hypothetical protein